MPGGAAAVDVTVTWRHEDFQRDRAAGGTAAVVDCLRATTTIAAALHSGSASVVPVVEEADARGMAERSGAVLAGERQCLPPPGFALGNSPREFVPARVAGRDVVLWTTNGTRALLAAAPPASADLVAFALVNVSAVAAHVADRRPPRLSILCAGTEGAFSLEDAFTAGALVDRILTLGVPARLEEQAAAARLLYLGGRSASRAVFAATGAAARLRARGLEADVDFACREDACPVVPVWRDNALRAASSDAGPAPGMGPRDPCR